MVFMFCCFLCNLRGVCAFFLGWGEGGTRGDSAFCFVFLMRMNILICIKT